jgi:hypothetical protein
MIAPEILDTLGVVLTCMFCISPLPTLYTAIFKDPKAIKSLSLSGTLNGLLCGSVIGGYCYLLNIQACLNGTYINVASALLILFTICFITRDL